MLRFLLGKDDCQLHENDITKEFANQKADGGQLKLAASAKFDVKNSFLMNTLNAHLKVWFT